MSKLDEALELLTNIMGVGIAMLFSLVLPIVPISILLWWLLTQKLDFKGYPFVKGWSIGLSIATVSFVGVWSTLNYPAHQLGFVLRVNPEISDPGMLLLTFMVAQGFVSAMTLTAFMSSLTQ